MQNIQEVSDRKQLEQSKVSAKPWITCVVPAYNEVSDIFVFLTDLCRHLSKLTDRYQVIVVDDGSEDGTGLEVISAAKSLPICLIGLSRNFGKEAAISAGLKEADGDVVVIMDADFQHPFAVIDEFIHYWKEGYEMVYGVRTDRKTDPPVRRLLNRFFYQMMSNLASVDLPTDAGDFRLLDRKVVQALRNLPERNRFMKGLYSWVGFRSIGIPFAVEERQRGNSRFNFRGLFSLAVTGLTSFSSFPLRLWMGVGSLISGLSIVYAIYVAVKTLIYGNPVPGWSTLAVAVIFLGGIQLLSIGILGEYIARIFNEVKQRPNYLVSERHDFRSK